VEPAAIGIALDGKIWYPSLLACHAALGALVTRKPVKILLSRLEDFRFSPKRNGAEIRIRSALGDKGQVLATEITAAANLGAYGVFADEILDRTCLASLGSYKPGNVHITGRAVSTNLPPAGPFAGFGMAQGFFAMECHASRIAGALRQDPMEWRADNMPAKKRPLAIGPAGGDAVPLDDLMNAAAALGDFRRKWASCEMLKSSRRGETDRGEPLRGIGIAAAYQGSGFLHPGSDRGVYAVELTLDKEGKLEIRTGIVSFNNDYARVWQKIAAEILAIEEHAVTVVSGSTALGIDSGPAALSRNITVLTRLVENACLAVRKQRFRDPLPITVRRSCRPAKTAGWAGSPIDGNAFARLGRAAAVVEVEIDPIEYTPKVRAVSLAVDSGKILSESGARRSLKIAIAQALGWASREILAYEDGEIPGGRFPRYGVMSPAGIPPIRVEFIRSESHPKGIGELPFNCIPAAFVQAVSQAADYPFAHIPLTARDIWDAEKTKHEKEDA
jgi:CO/xanthine dehydrogenase Mo-binding subunit